MLQHLLPLHGQIAYTYSTYAEVTVSKITKDAAYAAILRFVREFGRYPTKYDYKKVDYLYSPGTSRRLIGNLRDLTILEEVYYENPKRCVHCSTPIEFSARDKKKFCNHSCAAQHINKGRRKDPVDGKMRYYSEDRLPNCLSCGKELHGKKTKFCDLQCQQDFRTKERMVEWQEGKHFENRVIRRFLEILHGYKCSVCGLSEWNEKPITLEVEHKDGNSEDSSPENVCLICPNCHSQTDTYKGKNKGKGRHKRRQRYQEGKSY